MCLLYKQFNIRELPQERFSMRRRSTRSTVRRCKNNEDYRISHFSRVRQRTVGENDYVGLSCRDRPIEQSTENCALTLIEAVLRVFNQGRGDERRRSSTSNYLGLRITWSESLKSFFQGIGDELIGRMLKVKMGLHRRRLGAQYRHSLRRRW